MLLSFTNLMYRLSRVPTFECATSFRLHLSDLIDASIPVVEIETKRIVHRTYDLQHFRDSYSLTLGQQWYRLCFR
jgi:hypothetical protein